MPPCKVSHHSNGALLASFTKTHSIEVIPQNYNKTTMCWDGNAPYSPKSLSMRSFDHPQPTGREGLLTFILHFSLRVKGIMVSVVSQMLCQDLNTEPHHLAATFYLRGLLNTSFSSYPNNTPYPETLDVFQIIPISYHPHQYSIPKGLPAIVNNINLSSCLCVASGETLMGDHSICGPWARNYNPVTVELETFRHSCTLPVISMDFQKDKKTIDNISQIGQP